MRTRNRPGKDGERKDNSSVTDTNKRPSERVFLAVRVSEERRSALREEALHRGQSLTEYINELLDNRSTT